MPQLKIKLSDGTVQSLLLPGKAVTFGRAVGNDFSFPRDTALSRRHLVLSPGGDRWFLEDLKSKNGTRLNGQPVTKRRELAAGDVIEAGGITLYFASLQDASSRTVIFFPDSPTTVKETPGIARTLSDVVNQGEALPAALSRDPVRSAALISALLEAGRELSGHRTLPELFQLFLDLILKSVGANRGVILTLEEGELVPCAALGDEFQISRTVRDRVLQKRESLLIADVDLDETLRDSDTLLGQKVRSLMAVPLQTREKVIGLIYVDSPELAGIFNTDDLGLVTVLANIAAARIEHVRLLQVEQKARRLRQELEQAAEIQQSLFPKQTPLLRGIEVDGMSIPCRAVGGDFYDYLPLADGRLAILVADVAGKGLPAALLMSGLLARIQVFAGYSSSPAEICTRLNRIFSETCPGNRFVTLFLLALDPETGAFSYCNAGHNPPYLIRKDGSHELLEAGGAVIGIMSRFYYREGSGMLNPEDLLLMFSDGVTEGRNSAGVEFGEDRLLSLLNANAGLGAAGTVELIRQSVDDFRGATPAEDDVTLVAIRRPQAQR